MMHCALEVNKCLNKYYGVARPTDAGSDAVINSRAHLESARGTVAELPFFRAHLIAISVQKTAVGRILRTTGRSAQAMDDVLDDLTSLILGHVG